MTGPPLFAAPLYGLRSWRVVVDEQGERLAGPHQGTSWPVAGAWLDAVCPRGHPAPAPRCDCGVHAWHPSRRSARDVLAARAVVPGIVEAQGPIEVHEDGFRAEQARPYALVLLPGRNPHLIGRLADRYDVPVVEVRGPDALLEWCREHGLGMDEEVVAELLGATDPGERRRARMRKARLDALRVAVALLVSALLVVLGLALATDPPGDRTLHGRTGEIEVHNP